MSSNPLNIKYWLALLLLAMLVIVFISLGRWQLQRADERRAIQAAIENGQQRSSLLLQNNTPESEMLEWRAVTVTGLWQPQFSVLLNRNHSGKPGYWLATPLLLEPVANRRAVLVLRGWFGQRIAPDPLPVFPVSGELQTIQGQFVAHVPRVFELPSMTGKKQAQLPVRLPLEHSSLPQVQNLALDELSQASGLAFMPIVVQETGQNNDGLLRDWEKPPVDFHKNMGYAMQWFGFALIALIALVFVGYKGMRRSKTRIDNE